jgi:hypothetical protein
VGGLHGAFVRGLSGGQQFAPGPLGKPLHPHLVQHLIGGAQMLSRLAAAALAAEPLAIQQVGAGEVGT